MIPEICKKCMEHTIKINIERGLLKEPVVTSCIAYRYEPWHWQRMTEGGFEYVWSCPLLKEKFEEIFRENIDDVEREFEDKLAEVKRKTEEVMK